MSYLSTGQASKLLSVTPDTILKWVKQGRLPALRTPGGHYRIPEEDINAVINSRAEPQPSSGRDERLEKPLLHCWEFFGSEEQVTPGCQECLVYRAQALKCFEMKHLSKDLGYKGGVRSGSCDKCSYYRYHLGRPYNVLVITDKPDCVESLTGEKESERIRLQFASCEYECSLLIERFRPDFVVVDCAMQEDKCRELCHHLANDPRIQGNTIILAAPARKLSISFPGTVRIRHPFTLQDLEDHLSNSQVCYAIKCRKEKLT